MNKVAAIDLFGGEEGFRGQGPLGLEEANPWRAFSTLNNIISTTIGAMTAIAFIWFIVQFFTAAVSIIGAGGDKAKMEMARKKITNSIVGLVAVVAAVFLIDLIGGLLGLDILNPAETILKIGGQ